MELENKVAYITGAASGIGRAEAVRFTRAGARVAIVDRDIAAAEKVAAEIEAAGGIARAFHADLAEPASAQAAVAAALDLFGRIDVLGYTAGMFDGGLPSDEVSVERWNEVFAVNLGGLFHTTNAVLPQMIERGSGTIVIVASNAGLIGGGGGAAYTASKHAVVGYGRQLAVDYGPRGVRTNVIAPGLIETPMAAAVVADPRAQELMRRSPAGRHGQPEEIAEAALFLASDAASYIHGVVLSVDGGRLASVA
ncbi:SDR family NAD(P)-dependent oxidoreductase [Streptomyces chartreusis]|uniref:SDR family NAD(P)-dependent oxidoreductase n=1 Tax=Streptomyces chartreusis TaxID=1969 RepID=UPI00371F61DB